LHEIVTAITEGKGVEEDIQTLSELGEVIRDTSLCGLGQTAPNPLLATLHYFRDEYMAHIRQKRCDAAVCKEIVSAPCQHVCPIGQEAGVYIGLIAQDRMREAVEIVKKDNPLAAVLSRVCHHPCEAKCRAAESGDPISIRSLKRFVTDYGLKENIMTKADSVEKDPDKKVAVVGSGPAGLTCSFYLAQKGYDVTVFEKLPVVGGMLAAGIPEYRLPRKILTAEIDFVKSAGVTMKTGVSLGNDFSIDDLFRQGHKAIFVATGAYESLKLGIANEEVDGVVPAMRILEKINLDEEVQIGKKVGVVGGGNAAIDVSRSLLRTGIPEEVTVFYRRTAHEMPAFKEEIEAALEEGVQIRFLTAPVKIEVRNGRLDSCQFVRMRLGEIDTSGRRKPIAVEGSEFTVRMDNLVVAIGERPDTAFLRGENLETSKRNTLIVDRETLLTNREGVFAGGDLVLGPSTVVEAVAHGKLAADSIDMFLRGEKPRRQYEVTRPSIYVEPVELSEEELSVTKRTEADKQPLHTRRSSFQEVEFCYSKGQATKEARRCLRCGLETREGQQFLEELRQPVKEG
jgi:NADH-quinone oxidoreductase subunit F